MTGPGGNTAPEAEYLDPGGLDPVILRVLVSRYLDEHPGKTDEQVLADLATHYARFDPDHRATALRAALKEARAGRLDAEGRLKTLRTLWGTRYDITWSPGQYVAVSRDEHKRTYSAPAPGQLEAYLRDDYAKAQA